MSIKEIVSQKLIEAVEEAGFQMPVDFDLSVSPRPEFGDFSTNFALIASKVEEKSPTEIAQAIVSKLKSQNEFSKIEIKGNGFINFFLNDELYFSEFREILSKGDSYGSSAIGAGKKIQVEYISANPTGPVHIGNARGGPIGQTIANLHKFFGSDVESAFYVNDIGNQVEKLGESFYYWYEKNSNEKIEFPEGGYPGEYVKEISAKICEKFRTEIEKLNDREELIGFFKEKGLELMIERIKHEVAMLGISFDKWIYQSELEKSGKTKEVISELEKRGATVKREGALWFVNPEDPEYQDRECVLEKSDGGSLTYFADDIACHAEKFKEGNDLAIDIFGANHHGHLSRMYAAIDALGIDRNKLKIILYQNVQIKNGEEIIKMSKREGNFILLSDVINYGVGSDVFKYFILTQNVNTPIDFDVSLAKDKSEKNPVYYIQYAHARICSILSKAGKGSVGGRDEANIKILNSKEEIALIKLLTQFPDILVEIYNSFQIQILPRYLFDLAGAFHNFYTHCQVISGDKKQAEARLELCRATKIVFENGLKICGIRAPEKM